MNPPTQPCRALEPDTGDFRFGPVDRERLARYLEVPSAEALDPVTREEIDRLDRGRDELLGFWRRAVAVPIDRIDGRWIELEGGLRLRSIGTYSRQLCDYEADWLIVTAFTVGASVDARVKRHLARGELFEAFVLNQWAAVMTEQARAWLTHALCAWADRHGRSLLPYHGPGYNGWPLEEMAPLLRVLGASGASCSASSVHATDAGLLKPLHSMLIVYGATPRRVLLTRAENLAQCHRCAMRNCRYRVAPMDPGIMPEIAGLAAETLS